MGPNGGHLLAEPGDAPPPRWRDAVDQRRHAGPVDHPGRHDRAVPQGRQHRLRARHVVRRGNGNDIASCDGQTTCAVADATTNPGTGHMTFYYTNQQSARLMFYHDHAYGITRLNVYAGEAAGYLVQDPAEQALVAPARSRRPDPARHRGQDVRPLADPARGRGPDVEHDRLRRLRQPLVPPRLHAEPEPGRRRAAPTRWAAGTTGTGSGRSSRPTVPETPEPALHHSGVQSDLPAARTPINPGVPNPSDRARGLHGHDDGQRDGLPVLQRRPAGRSASGS